MKQTGAETPQETIFSETFDRILRTWALDPLASIPRLDRSLVHKSRDENVFVSRLERVVEGEEDVFAMQLFLDPEHAFFFEHPLDHIPGLMLVEAGRQAATAASHIYYGVPAGSVFILRDLAVDFTAFADLDRPVFALSRVCDRQVRKGQLTGMFCKGAFFQNEKQIGIMSGRWMIMDRPVAERMREVWRAGAPAARTEQG
ncbi:MAG TPA: AfsA-related hotdog domain-containing protein [Thermoanaerobaculia bacterium]|jgi:hypothetical protein|nr:AfsA-related hotdog domain-containing protein [Thermoanaerobaculia bacterium]